MNRERCIDAAFIAVLIVMTIIGLAVLFATDQNAFGYVIRGIVFGGLLGYILAWFRFKSRGGR